VLILVAGAPPEPDRSGPAVEHRPDLVGADPEAVAAALAARVPDVYVAAREPGPDALARWRAAAGAAPLLAVTDSPGTDSPGTDSGYARHGIARLRLDTLAYPEVLAAAERAWNDLVSRPPVRRPPPAGPGTVTVVGAGVVNLVTALGLVRAGHAVTVYDRAPDPRAGADWTAYGCSRGGGDGRMFTLTEADSYNDRSWAADGRSNGLLDRPVSGYGWRVLDPARCGERERQWAADFHRVPPWLAASFNADIFAVNQAAAPLWDRLIEKRPELFGAGYQDGILRLYSDAAYFRRHIERNRRVGAVRRVLDPAEVAADYPALAAACAGGALAGGMEVTGFTVDIHGFLGRLVTLLERLGVEFRWGVPVSAVRWADGTVDGVQVPDGVVRSRHYVLSPGAYGHQLLAGTDTAGEIQGMLGVWLTVPNTRPRLGRSLKVARAGHKAEETNVTVGTDAAGEPVLICGSGYGWTGLDPTNIDPAELEELYRALEDTVRTLFPHTTGDLTPTRRLCVRPWTASCLGVFEQVPVRGGGLLVVTGGHNTGGFAQAPVIAEAVRDALAGRTHPMHTRYHPARLRRFYGLTAPQPSPA
jgi:glycine/D-amino acid oxidase-like deaminating enzyme